MILRLWCRRGERPPTPRGTDGYRAPSLQARGAPTGASSPPPPPPRLMQAHGGAHASRGLTLEERSASCRRGGAHWSELATSPLPPTAHAGAGAAQASGELTMVERSASCRREAAHRSELATSPLPQRLMQARGPPSKRTTPAQRGLNQRLVAGRVEARLSTFHPCRRLHHQPEPGARACRQRQLRW